MTLRIIGDAHGKYGQYCEVAKGARHSLQLGDMGFDYVLLDTARKHYSLSDDKHKFFGGNHDNYDCYSNRKLVPFALGHWGSYKLGGVKFFYIRGAFSIDKKWRQYSEPKSWWKEEQLTTEQANRCVYDYAQAKPDLVITHGCPTDIAEQIGNPGVLRDFGFDPDTFSTPTQKLLQTCLEIHQPEHWYFGHFHVDINLIHKGTKFHCLNELSFVDIKE